MSYALYQCCELDLNWPNDSLRMKFELDCWILAYWLRLMIYPENCFYELTYTHWINIFWIDVTLFPPPMDFLYSFICFEIEIFISPPLFVSFMHLSITWFWAFTWQGLEEMVKVRMLGDKGKLGRFSKYSLETKETWELISCTQGCLL